MKINPELITFVTSRKKMNMIKQGSQKPTNLICCFVYHNFNTNITGPDEDESLLLYLQQKKRRERKKTTITK